MATVVTKTIKPAGGGDYTTLAAALAANAGNLVTLDRVLRLECYGGGSCGAVSSPAGYTTDATRYVMIVAAADQRHAGVWDAARARTGQMLVDTIANARLFDMLVENTLGGDYCASFSATPGASSADGCIFRQPSTGTLFCVNGYPRLTNCIIYNTSTVGGYGCSFHSAGVDNCTVIGFSVGFNSSGSTSVVRNCIAQGCSNGFNGSAAATSDYNISDLASDAPGANSKAGTVAFVNAAARDYHLAAGDTVARGAGTNLTSSGITTDIDGQTRPASGAWDIGADQFIVSGGITMRQVALQSVAMSQPQLRAISA